MSLRDNTPMPMTGVNGNPAPSRVFERSSLGERLLRRMEQFLQAGETPSADDQNEPDWKLNNILVATDFSACSGQAVERAAALARHHDARLTILHVIDVNPPIARSHCGSAESLMKELWFTANSELCRLSEILTKQQTRTQTLMVEGLPAESIIENSSSFDLLVIGEQRARPTWNFFSRHTSRCVVEGAQCPVLVVRQ